MRRTAVIVSGSSPSEMALWVTASARDWKDSPAMALQRADGRPRTDQLPRQVAATLWATPTASANKSIRTPEGAKKEVARGKSPDLTAQTMALWPTPTSLAPAAAHYNGAGNSAGLVAIRGIALGLYPTPTTACASGGQTSRSGKRKHEPLLRGVALDIETKLWPTPQARETAGGEYADSAKARARMASGHQVNLSDAIKALWPTPLSAPDSPASHGQLSGQFRTAMQQALPGSSDTTAKPAGSLNPEFVFWLMGFPDAFLSCAPPAMRSSRSSRRKSSARCAEDETVQSSTATPT